MISSFFCSILIIVEGSMKKIRFENINDIKKYLNNIGVKSIYKDDNYRYIIDNDNYYYKFYHKYLELTNDFIKLFRVDYNSFNQILFPIEIFFLGSKIIGYKCKYIRSMNIYNSNLSKDDIYLARSNIIDELKRISNSRIYLYKLSDNIIFNGKDFYIGDVLCFKLLLDKSSDEVYELNKEEFNKGLANLIKNDKDSCI